MNILIAEQTHFYNEILTDFNWHDKGPKATHQRVQIFLRTNLNNYRLIGKLAIQNIT